MSWFKRKTKEEKLIEKQQEVDYLNEKWKNELNSYCKIGKNIFILKSFEIWKDDVYVRIQTTGCVEGYDNMIKLCLFFDTFDHDNFSRARREFIQFKNELNKIGLEIKKIE